MKLVVTVFLMAILSSQAKSSVDDSLFNVLKQETLKKGLYDAQKLGHIRALKQILTKTSRYDLLRQYELTQNIYDEYRNFTFDSAHVYAQQLHTLSIRLKDVSKQHESKIKLGAIQLSWGMYKEAFDCIEEINPNFLHKEVKSFYFGLKAEAYLHLYYYNTDRFYAANNRKLALNALDSALYYSHAGTYERFRYTAEICTLKGRKDLSVDIYKRLLGNSTLNYHVKAMVANDLSNLSSGLEAVRLVNLAAIYDVRSSTKETLAIFTLAKYLFNEGEFDKAEFLLKDAKEQAEFYGNKIHENEIDAVLTMLKAKKLIKSETDKNHTMSVLILTLLILIISTLTIALVFFLRLKRLKVRETVVNERVQSLDNLNKSLSEDGRIKEEYIGYFFNIISSYIQRLERIKRHAEHCYKMKSFPELLTIAKEIDIKRERDEMFYRFDSIFLKLFPNFVTSFNSLLNENDQIWPKANQVLNTNLRIFALIRLGIKDTQTIANIMENSVSTIYTYKTRIKSKACVSPDEFDKKIMEIKFAYMK